MKKNKLIIYGHGKYAEYVKYAFTNDTTYEVIGFCLESSYLSTLKSTEGDKEIFNFDNIEENFPPDQYDLFIAVGSDKVRERLFLSALSKGFSPINYISSKALFWDNLKLGKNVFISENSAIQPFVEIGDNTIIIGAEIGHHCIIGSHSLLSTCVIGATARIGNNCFLGINSSVKNGLQIGDKNIIGMGCIMTRNTGDLEVYSTPSAVKRKVTYTDIADRFL